MGPLENADYVGLDLTLAIHKAVLPALSRGRRSRARCCRAWSAAVTSAPKPAAGFLPWDPGSPRERGPRPRRARAGADTQPGRPMLPLGEPARTPAGQSTRWRIPGSDQRGIPSMTFQWPSSPKEAALEFYDLSHPWGHGVPAWPYFEDVKIERLHGMAKSRVLTQKITTVMHSGTHIDAPGHVVEGAPLLDEIPLSAFFGTGVVVSIPKKKWEVVTPDDLEAARPEIRPGDIVIVNTGWHHHYSDSAQYYAYSPGFYKEAGEWFAARGVKAVGTDTQALDHPLATAIGPHGPGRGPGRAAALGGRRVRGGDRPQGPR